ncbi:MAG: hypothetical protein HOP02_08180 [Methylococcaceae bacterium]|nr:hypothetical protein [Methylococcaceae bacterium]
MINRFSILNDDHSATLSLPTAARHSAKTASKNAAHMQTKSMSRHFGQLPVILAAIALLIGGGYYYNQHVLPTPPTMVQPITGYLSNEQLEAQYGIRITLIAVTAVGGIVDFRYKVVDPEKASNLLHDPANAPTLTAVDTGLTLSPTHMGRHHNQMTMKRGAVPFTFYPNVRNAVKAGTPVSVAFGKIKVTPIAAQ